MQPRAPEHLEPQKLEEAGKTLPQNSCIHPVSSLPCLPARPSLVPKYCPLKTDLSTWNLRL